MRYLLNRQVYTKDHSLPTSDGESFAGEIVPRVRLMLSIPQSRGVRANNLDRELEKLEEQANGRAISK